MIFLALLKNRYLLMFRAHHAIRINKYSDKIKFNKT
jgi:hypothetical protein